MSELWTHRQERDESLCSSCIIEKEIEQVLKKRLIYFRAFLGVITIGVKDGSDEETEGPV